MGGVVQITPHGGGGAANANYVTRRSAAEEGEAVYHNAPEDVESAQSWEETRIRLRSWAEQTKTEERARHGNRAGQARTHYRMVLSYEEEIETEAAREDAKEFLEEEFEEAQAVGVVHQDTPQTHVHIWMSARKLDGKKVHINRKDLKDLHASFDRIYEERMNVRSRNAAKIEETRRFKRAYAELEAQGASATELKQWAEANRPDRADPPGPEVYRAREERQQAKGAVEEARREREPRAHEVEEEVEWRKEQAERQKRSLQRTKKWIEELNQQNQTHEHDERRTQGSKQDLRAGAEGAERGERAAESADSRIGSRGGQGSHRHRAGGFDVGHEESRGRSQTGGREGLEGEKQRGGSGEGRGESEREDGRRAEQSGADYSGRNRAGSGEFLDRSSSGADRGRSRARSGQNADRGDGLDRDGGPDREHDRSGRGSAGGGDSERPHGPLSENQRWLLRALRRVDFDEAKSSKEAQQRLLDCFMHAEEREIKELDETLEEHMSEDEVAEGRILLEWGAESRRKLLDRRASIESELSEEGAEAWERVLQEVDAAAEAGSDVDQRLDRAAAAWRSVAKELEQGERGDLLWASMSLQTAQTVQERAQKQVKEARKQRGSQESGQDKSTDQSSSKDRGGQSWGGGRGGRGR